MKKKSAIILVAVVVLITVGSLLFWQNKNSVAKIAPKRGPIVEAIYGLGKVKTDLIYEAKVGIVTSIQKLFVHEGDKVKEGDRLISLSSGTLFKAPFSGTVTKVAFREGENIFPQIPILQVENFDNLYIEVLLEQQAALNVRPDQSVKVLFESLRGTTYKGVVRSIFPRSDEFIAQIEVEGLPKEVLPGMTADVSIEVGRKEEALLIPVAAIQSGRVLIERNEKRESKELRIGVIDGQWAEVMEGDIQDTDLVLVKKSLAEANK